MVENETSVEYNSTVLFYLFVFFMVFVATPLLYVLSPMFKEFIDIQWGYIQDDWQLQMCFILATGLFFGKLIVEALALFLYTITFKVARVIDDRSVFVVRFFVASNLILILIIAFFGLGLDSPLPYLLSFLITIGFTLAVKQKADLDPNWRLDSFSIFSEDYSELRLNWKHIAVLFSLVLLFLLWLFKTPVISDWVSFVFLAMFSPIIGTMLIIFLFLTIGWPIIKFVLVIIPNLLISLMSNVVKLWFNKLILYSIIFIILVLLGMNIDLLGLDAATETFLSFVFVLFIYLLRMKLRLR